VVFPILDSDKGKERTRGENTFITMMRSSPFNNTKCAQSLTLLETLMAEQEGKSEEREVVFEMVRACMMHGRRRSFSTQTNRSCLRHPLINANIVVCLICFLNGSTTRNCSLIRIMKGKT
jgi:hypothetical protein